ncbi:hypothetical protein BDN72DRAFT_837528 [Pluteus cervinus]|uniref:Uncharacterized protein n=1 Tax=Pluteus cervinus TaxID=181527 RepID=A0ACD3B0R3_9AGAR|nr:hypothetical protein BDN72DRAFT_837528 [Pluteus cervinus]
MAPWILFANIGLWSLGRLSFQPQTRAERLIVDDRDDRLQFKGNWVQEVGPHTMFGSAPQSTRTGSGTVGDQMKFEFIGSSIGVYGVTNPGSGQLAFNISLDDAPPVTHIQFDGTQQNESSNWLINQEFFSFCWDKDPPQRHELTITVHEATKSQALWLDYITLGLNQSTAFPLLPSSNKASASPPRHKRSHSPSCTDAAWIRTNVVIVVPILSVIVALILPLWIIRCRNRPNARSTPPHNPTIQPGPLNTPFHLIPHVDDPPIPPPYTRESAMPEVATPSAGSAPGILARMPLARILQSSPSHSSSRMVNDLRQQLEELRQENQRIKAEFMGRDDVYLSRPVTHD